MKKQLQIEHTDPNWWEADQLAVYKDSLKALTSVLVRGRLHEVGWPS